jgi:hypothetical protein
LAPRQWQQLAAKVSRCFRWIASRVDLVIASAGELAFAFNENAGFSANNHQMDRSRMVSGDVVLGCILRTADVRFYNHQSLRPE